MKNFHYILAFFAPLFVVLGGCKMEDDSIIKSPPSYSEGKNSGLGCTVNGRKWWANYRPTPHGLGGGLINDHPKNPAIVFGGKGSELRLTSYYYKNAPNQQVGELISFWIFTLPDTGTYKFGNNEPGSLIKFNNNGNSANIDTCGYVDVSGSYDISQATQGYGYHNYGKGELRVTYINPSSRYISGRFWADLCRPGCDTIRIRDGVFDVAY